MFAARHCIVMLVAIALLLSAGDARANLIINGSFETPDVTNGTYVTIFPGGEPAGFGWSVVAGSVDANDEELNAGQPLGPAYDGRQFLDLNGTLAGTLSQTFATTPGVSYTLDFAYSNNFAFTNMSDPATAVVTVTDTGIGNDLITPLTISHGTGGPGDQDWTVESLTFAATGSNTTLTFTSTRFTTPLGGILLDGVSVVGPAAVPAPGGLALVGVGLLAAGVRRTWRRVRAG